MYKRLENKFTMYNSVNAFLTDNGEMVNSIPELNESCLEFSAKCSEIKLKEELKRNATTGKAISKLRSRNTAITGCIAVSAALYSLAKKNNDHELAEISDIPRSRLEVMRDAELVEVLESVYELAFARLGVLEPFGINTSKLEGYKNVINRYNEAFGKSQTGVVKRKGAVQSLPELFRQGDEILAKVDKYVKGMRDVAPEFVRNYEDSRLIRNLGIRHKKDNEDPPVPGQQQSSPPNGSPPDNNSPPGNGS